MIASKADGEAPAPAEAADPSTAGKAGAQSLRGCPRRVGQDAACAGQGTSLHAERPKRCPYGNRRGSQQGAGLTPQCDGLPNTAIPALTCIRTNDHGS
jgi:hypothetical protein